MSGYVRRAVQITSAEQEKTCLASCACAAIHTLTAFLCFHSEPHSIMVRLNVIVALLTPSKPALRTQEDVLVFRLHSSLSQHQLVLLNKRSCQPDACRAKYVTTVTKTQVCKCLSYCFTCSSLLTR